MIFEREFQRGFTLNLLKIFFIVLLSKKLPKIHLKVYFGYLAWHNAFLANLRSQQTRFTN